MRRPETHLISRRCFLKLIASTGLVIAMSADGLSAVLETSGKAKGTVFSPNAWLHISEKGEITIYCSQSEMGQGVLSVLPAIVADELDADWQRVQVRQAPVSPEYEDPVWKSQVTAGSASVRHFYLPLRRAGAQARQMLIAAAAEKWKVPYGECRTHKARVLHVPSGRSMGYGKLACLAAGLKGAVKPVLKPEKAFDLIGKSIPRIDSAAKINGTACYGMDVRVKNMLYCVMKRPRCYGAIPVRVDSSRALETPGLEKLFRIADKIAVVARSPFSAIRARDRLKIRWKGGEDPGLGEIKIQQIINSALDRPGKVHTRRGRLRKAVENSYVIHQADYFLPYLAHACMEPMNCTASVSGKQCRIWAPCQNQSDIMEAAREETGLGPENIDIITTFMGGSFGRRFEVDFIREALQVATRVKRPVKLFWTRDDDFRHDYFRPANSARIKAGVDSTGNITFWQHKVAAPSVYWRIAPSLLADGIDPSAVESIHNSAYSFPVLHLEYVWIKDLAPPLGFWRSVGNSHNCFTIESFMDELAFRTGMDPLEFRLRNLKHHPRAARVLETAAQKAGWDTGPRRGQALGLCQHFLVYTYVAAVAEVSVDKKSGQVRVHRIVCAVDCGKAVNPAVVRQQIEGGMVFGLSAALKEWVSFSGGGVETAGFSDYPLLTMSETPEVEVHIVESGSPPTGVGEVGTAPVAPAVANAVFRAAGVRIRTLPMTRTRIRTELERTG